MTFTLGMFGYSKGGIERGWGKAECQPVWSSNNVHWADIHHSEGTKEKKKRTTSFDFAMSGILQSSHKMTNQNKFEEKDIAQDEMMISCSDNESPDGESSDGLIHNKEKLFKCKSSDYTVKQADDHPSHNAKHKSLYRCIICNYVTKEKRKLAEHTERHVGNRCYKCDLCGYSAVSYKDLKQHISSHVRLNIYTCDVCGHSTHSKTILNGHMKVHRDEKPFRCEICGFTTKYRQYLRRHLRTHTANRNDRITCEICKKSIIKSRRLEHMVKHGEKKYKCNICRYASHYKDALELHMRTHTGEQKYKCSLCGTSFSQKGSLTRHMRIHSGERDYKCDICGYAFNQDSALKRHMRTHLNEKLIKCSHCDYSCHQNGQLKLHYTRKHKELNEK